MILNIKIKKKRKKDMQIISSVYKLRYKFEINIFPSSIIIGGRGERDNRFPRVSLFPRYYALIDNQREELTDVGVT